MAKREKAVYFYKIFPSPSFNIDMSNDQIALSQMFNSVFSNKDSTYAHVFSDKNTYYFDIIEIDDKFVFGKYSKKEPNPDDKIQMREASKSKNVKKAKSLPQNTDLEYYTFFLVDFQNQMIGYISNRQSGKLNKVLAEYFLKHEMNISIISYYVSDTKKIMDAFKSISQLELNYNAETASEEFKGLLGSDGLANGDEAILSSFNLSIKFKSKAGTKAYLEKIIEKKNRFDRINIKGETESNILQSFDVIQKSFMIHEMIELSGSPMKNLENIKESIKKSINKICAAQY